MAWRWVPDVAPTSDLGRDLVFPTQGEAESWLGEFYPDLVEAGVRAVSLYEEDRAVYGPMKLDGDGG